MLEANDEARRVLREGKKLFAEVELKRRRAQQQLVSIVSIVLAILSAVLGLLKFANVDSPLMLRAVAALPAPEYGLNRAREAEEAESRIMEGEKSAIGQLNEYQRGLLRVRNWLRPNIIAESQGPTGEATVLQLARQLDRDVVQQLERTDAEIHRSHERHNRADAEKETIEAGRMRLAGLGHTAFWIGGAQMVREAAAEEGRAQKRDDGGWSWCAIL